MRISTRHRFIYISTPKVCTHSIYAVLGEHFAEGLIEDGFHNVTIPPQYQDYPRWTVVRNPFSRAVSLWWSACRLHPEDSYGFRVGCGRTNDFTQFIVWLSKTQARDRTREPLMMGQLEWLLPVEPIHALHVEWLEEELSGLPFWRPGIVVPKLNTTAEKIQAHSRAEGHFIHRPPWREMYRDQAARAAVLEWAGEDFERFGYSTEIHE